MRTAARKIFRSIFNEVEQAPTPPPVTEVLPPAAEVQTIVVNPLLRFEERAPSHQTAVDVFRDRWASDLQPLIGVTGTGSSLLFTKDARPLQAAQILGKNDRFDGYDVLELGPLEAGHTYLLEGLGAASITAVEANVEAYLKCLVVKEVLDLKRSKFLLGDVVEYLANARRFDLIFCSGILYHMTDPLALIQKICELTDRCFIWTMYYDPSHNKVLFESRTRTLAGFSAEYWSHDYGDKSSQFWGGNKATASWLSKDTIIEAFRHFGLSKVTVVEDKPDHPTGAAITLAAARP